MSKLSGQVALITGGASGIGKGTAQVFLSNNIKVCIADIDKSGGEVALKELQSQFGAGNVIFKKLDVCNEKEFEDVFKATKAHFGHLDIFINNAGIINEIDWKKMVDINVVAVINGVFLAQKYLEGKNKEHGGTVINTASVAGLFPLHFLPAYCTTKHAVIGLSLTWGHENNVKETKVKVNAVCPDVTDTAILRLRVQLPAHKDDFSHVINAIGDKILSPIDIGNGMLQVLQEGVTGAVLVVHHSKGPYYYDPPQYPL